MLTFIFWILAPIAVTVGILFFVGLTAGIYGIITEKTSK